MTCVKNGRVTHTVLKEANNTVQAEVHEFSLKKYPLERLGDMEIKV